ncbi:MAG: alpha/beta hydrolase [Bacteroidales bacterium]|nr:alpha/beta hydrolase [Bacteroidales bacterium]
MNPKRFYPLVYLTLLSLLFGSCALRTYTISEKTAFTPTQYKLSLDSFELSEMPKNERERLLLIADRIIDSSEQRIADYDDLLLNREYLELNDSLVVEYFCYIPKEYTRIIVFFIGNQSCQSSYVSYLQKLAIETQSKIYTWHYRGYGYSNGKPSFKTQFADNQNIFTHLKCNESEKELIVIGYSLGSVFATQLGAGPKVDKLILLAPFSDVPDLLTHYKRQIMKGLKFVLRPFIDLRVKETYVNDVSNTRAIEKFKGDLLIVHSKNDQELPYSMGKKLYKRSSSPGKRMLTSKRGGHEAPFEEQNWDEIIKWINSEL